MAYSYNGACRKQTGRKGFFFVFFVSDWHQTPLNVTGVELARVTTKQIKNRVRKKTKQKKI